MEKNASKKLDKWDVAISVSSGALTAAMDVVWVNDISLADAHKWGTDQVNSFVMKLAKSKGFAGKSTDIAGAVRKLEGDYPMAGDCLTNDFGGGAHHHLRDFSHHPTPIGLLFSILMQFTGKGYGTDKTGKFHSYQIKDWKPQDWEISIYMGTVMWLFHIISDIAGSSGTLRGGREGTSLPGPMMSLLKEISSIPGIRSIAGYSIDKNGKETTNYQFSTICSKLFNGTLLGKHDENGKIIFREELRFDFRTELGILHESVNNMQHIPVVLNELIVSAFYSVRRFMEEFKEKQINDFKDIGKIEIRGCLPWKNEVIRHMKMIAAATFSSIDLSAAGIKAAIKNKDNPAGFALDFMQGINYWGLGDLAFASNSEMLLAVQKMHSGFVAAAEKQKQNLIAMLPDGRETYDTAKYAAATVVSVARIGTPIGFIAATVGVYDEVRKAIGDFEIAKQARIRIEAECSERIFYIREYRMDMEQMISDYLYNKMAVITVAFDTIDAAVTENDIESFILGNNMIQRELAGKVMFENSNDFDALMLSDDIIKF